MRNGIKSHKKRSDTHQQHWLPSSYVHNILCSTKSTHKIKPSSHCVHDLIPTSQPHLCLPSSHGSVGGTLFPKSADHIPSSVSREGSSDKSGVWKSKRKKTLRCLHYLPARRPVNEARVNCCWLDVSTRGWAGIQISARGPPGEERKGRGRSPTMAWNQCQVFLLS